MWTLVIRLTIDPPLGSAFPRRTDWVVVASPRYPWGGLHIDPAADRGIENTFPHQRLNEPIPDEKRRSGRICVDTGVGALGRQGLDPEPFTADSRMRWNLHRARRWTQLAAEGKLAPQGEPYELPDFKSDDQPLIAFSENGSSLQTWRGETALFGYVRLVHAPPDSGIRVVESYHDVRDREVYAPRWGTYISDKSHDRSRQLWIRFASLPHLRPWKAPMTWGELRQCAQEQGIDLDEALKKLLPFIRDGKEHVLLVGFPIPDRVGRGPTMVYWQPLLMGPVHRADRGPKGYRRTESNFWNFDRKRTLADEVRLTWLDAENWHEDTISARGLLPEAVRDSEVIVVGAGTLGSAISEMLVRGGVKRLSVLDDDEVEAGNLVRHSLTLDDIGDEKSEALSYRLNAASPHAIVQGFPSNFPSSEPKVEERLRTADIVIDTTGEDEVLAAMESYPWNSEKIFFSVSLGLEARTAFSYVAIGTAFPLTDFRRQLQPHLDLQRKGFEGAEWPRAGVGCWHPVFPARHDHVTRLAGATLSHLVDRVKAPPVRPELAVFERLDGEVRRRRMGD